MDGKFASLIHDAVNGDPSTMGLNDVLDDGQAQPGTALMTASGLVDSVKSLKETG